MRSSSSIGVVIPCYNEEEGVREVISRMPAVVDEIVVVDNNCTDRTAEVAASLGARVVLEKTPGYGAAYKAGLRAVRSDIVVTLDGDGTYPPAEIPRLVDILIERRLDFLSTSRFPLADPKAMGLTNRFGNWVLTAACALLFFKPIHDSQSGMWVFRRAALAAAFGLVAACGVFLGMTASTALRRDSLSPPTATSRNDRTYCAAPVSSATSAW